VSRSNSIKIKYFDGRKIITETFVGLSAKIIQHEYDHLQGILYTDKAIDIISRHCLAV
jgi:peptide deformylase